MLYNYCYSIFQYYFFILITVMHISLLGMQSNTSVYQALLTQSEYKAEYKELETKFGSQQLGLVLDRHLQGGYESNQVFQSWLPIANQVIPRCFEDKRRYFFVNIMLHAQTNYDGLEVLRDCFNNHLIGSHVRYSPQATKIVQTPQGPISTQLEPYQYIEAMNVSNGIRSRIFVNNISPLVLVRKTGNELSPATKWSLFKAGAVMMHLISLCCEKEKEKEGKKEKKKNSSLGSFLRISDAMQEAEEEIQNDLEKKYPILKTHMVKSLVDDKTWWLYDRKNWIACGSAFCMILLLYCLFHNKLPDMHRIYSVIIVA